MYETCLDKQQKVKELFARSATREGRYDTIIELGKSNTHLAPEDKTEANRVHGCQSTMYLKTTAQDGKLYFAAESDALISSGLAALLIMVYSGEEAETILKCPPSYLDELGISASLTPNRASGLYNIHLRMKQEALKSLVGKQ